MPFYEAVGRDPHTSQHRTVQISANDERHALFAATAHGISDPSLRAYSDRELLMMDLKCFLNAPKPAHTAQPAHNKSTAGVSYRPSLLTDHPILTITTAIVLGLAIDRLFDLVLALL